MAPNAEKTESRALQTFHYNSSKIHGTVWVQEHHDYVLDDEKHEENPRLESFMLPRHSAHIQAFSTTCTSCLAPSQNCASIFQKPNLDANHKQKRRISFGKITVREYGLILGDHPCCRFGLPTTLDWDYLEYESLTVNEYEIHHANRRPLKECYIYSDKRMEILKKEYSEKELGKAEKELKKVKKQRKISEEESSNSHTMLVGFESLSRLVTKIFTKNGKVREA